MHALHGKIMNVLYLIIKSWKIVPPKNSPVLPHLFFWLIQGNLVGPGHLQINLYVHVRIKCSLNVVKKMQGVKFIYNL